MLAILIGGALSAQMVYTQPKDTSKTAFDIKYSDKGKDKSLTGGEGFYVAFREYDDYLNPMPLQFLTWNKDLMTDNYRVSIEKMDDPDQKSIRIKFSISNYKNGWLLYDLGLFADSNYKSDEDQVTKAINDRALKFYLSGTDTDTPTLFINGTNFPKVDSIYLGTLANSASYDPSSYPFFNNSAKGSTQRGQDSVFAFSWQERWIQAGGWDTIGFIASPTSTYSMEPFIYDISPDYNQQYGDAALLFEVIDYDSRTVTVTADLNGTKETRTVKTNPLLNKFSEVINFSITLEEGTRFHYKIQAKDDEGHLAEEIENTIITFGGNAPYLDCDTKFQEDYNPKDVIYLEGAIDDEYEVTIRYQFDAGEITQVDGNFYTYADGKQRYGFALQIPNLKLGEIHNFSLWAEDEYGLKSAVITARFMYKNPDRPNITSAFLSDERILYDDQEHELVVFGDGSDPDPGQTVSIIAQIDSGNELNRTYFVSSDKLETFAFIHRIKVKALRPGHHTVTLYAVDNTTQESRSKVVLSFLVYDPAQPLPPEDIGKIVDVTAETIKPGSDALFNLRYIDTDQIQNSMTYNDEGYFAAFRIYEQGKGGKPLSTNIIKKRYVQQDNISIIFDIKEDKKTKFTTVRFRVKNYNFFERQIDLGIFADSDFSGDDNNKIELREDGRGITVTNEAKNIHYTIFTKDVRSGRKFSPPVSRYFIKDIKRDGNNKIPIDKIPFFSSSGTSSLSNANAMYGFSWTYSLPAAVQDVDDYELELPFAVSFVAHDKIKAPPKITDNTVIPDTVNPGDIINLSFSIRDYDLGEKLRFNLTIEYEDVLNETTYSIDTHGSEYVLELPIIVPQLTNGKYFSYSGIAEDTDIGYGFTSNYLYNYIYINSNPRITVNKLNATYNTKSQIKLTGKMNDVDPDSQVKVRYQFLDGDLLSRNFEFDYIEVHESLSFNYFIDIPPEVYPRENPWGISIWCEDYNGYKSERVNYTFKLNPYNPPGLKNAGINTRVATIGQELVGYAIIKDQEKDGIDVYVKVDGGSEYPAKPVRRIDNSEKSGEWKAVGFFWQVPNVNPGRHEVLFIARDAEGVPSETEIRKPLIIQANDY